MILDFKVIADTKPKEAASCSANGDPPYKQIPGRTQDTRLGREGIKAGLAKTAAEFDTLTGPPNP